MIRNHLALILVFTGLNSFGQNLELIKTGQLIGTPFNLSQAEFYPMPNGHYIIEPGGAKSYVYDFNGEKGFTPINSSLPNLSKNGNHFAQYDVYKGNVQILDGNSLIQIQKIQFHSVLNWYNFSSKKWGSSSAGGRKKIYWGAGDIENLQFKMIMYKDALNKDMVSWWISDKKNPSMIPKTVYFEEPITSAVIISKDLHYYTLLRGNKYFLEVAVTGYVEHGQFNPQITYYYLLGDYTKVEDYAESFFDNFGNFYLAPSSSGESNYKIFNPSINPSAFYAEISTSNTTIKSIKGLIEKYNNLGNANNFKVSFSKQGLDLFKISIYDKVTNKLVHEEEVSLGIKKPKKNHQAFFTNNFYSNELVIIALERNTFGLFSYKEIVEKYVSENPGLAQNQESNKPQSEKENMTVKLEKGVVSGTVVNGIRQGMWSFTDNNGKSENWEYKNGIRVDREYNEIRAKYEEATDQIRIGLSGMLLEPILKEYEAKVEKAQAFNKLLLQSATIAGGSILGSSVGMDQMNSLNFGVALNSDIQNGTTSNLDAFMDSYQSMSPNDPDFLNNMERSMGLPPTSSSTSTSENSNSNGSAGNNSLLGTWTTTSGNISIHFGGGGKGTLKYKDANNSGSCVEGTENNFNWTSTATSIELIYTSASVCGESQSVPESDGLKEYHLEGGSLKYLGATWTK